MCKVWTTFRMDFHLVWLRFSLRLIWKFMVHQGHSSFLNNIREYGKLYHTWCCVAKTPFIAAIRSVPLALVYQNMIKVMFCSCCHFIHHHQPVLNMNCYQTIVISGTPSKQSCPINFLFGINTTPSNFIML